MPMVWKEKCSEREIITDPHLGHALTHVQIYTHSFFYITSLSKLSRENTFRGVQMVSKNRLHNAKEHTQQLQTVALQHAKTHREKVLT